MFFNKSAFLVAAIVYSAAAAPLRARITSTDGGAANDVSPVNTCDSASLTPAIDNLIEFANDIQASEGSFDQDNFVFFDQGKQVLPGIISDLADAKTALGAGDLATVASKIQSVSDAFNTVPLDFEDGEHSSELPAAPTAAPAAAATDVNTTAKKMKLSFDGL
ncbi:hypothetical protein MSAN_00485900 [Mycena sanguinolenta]|uniref:Small secreted protein n=1 Tax=Mycena sanguinolenta TaxID=230812 RepID=A0A8H6ZAL6_9AGAR|nr:hypothetical protein MSAN_00485900 [Mycena sanguinolenta]